MRRWPGVGILGILNLTPDSFSDGGQHTDVDAAVTAGTKMWADGAWAVDVGGESTRPGATPVPVELELRRVLPVVEQLVAAGVTVSIDTMKSDVALACVAAGATVINDVSGGLHDPAMLDAVSGSGASYVLTHWRGEPGEMASRRPFNHPAAEVRAELVGRVEAAVRAGIPEQSLILDPGIGFAKSGLESWAVLRHLDLLVSLGLPVMLGLSRKSLFQSVTQPGVNIDIPVERDDLTAAASALAVACGVTFLRVHDVRANVRAAAVAQAWLGV
jgi:dihydropteroate synthase